MSEDWKSLKEGYLHLKYYILPQIVGGIAIVYGCIVFKPYFILLGAALFVLFWFMAYREKQFLKSQRESLQNESEVIE
jgi:hypothetical protein